MTKQIKTLMEALSAVSEGTVTRADAARIVASKFEQIAHDLGPTDSFSALEVVMGSLEMDEGEQDVLAWLRALSHEDLAQFAVTVLGRYEGVDDEDDEPGLYQDYEELDDDD